MRLKTLLIFLVLVLFSQVAFAQDDTAYRERWQVRSSLLLDTCGGAAQGASFPVVLSFNNSDELVHVSWYAQQFFMSPNNIPNGYGGNYTVGEAHYILNVMFDNDPNTFYAIMSVTFDSQPNCVWLIRWDGVPV